ncbi:MAG: LysR family transcriptional regulator [Verrucomicrobia bacterium]|nr:LysR family transcriptional regulator [Verrucomicrobiota bacterium]
MHPYPKIHHLELFYYVAKHEGITSAVRHMPYGIQQPAVSGQVLQLERDLGVKLFNRRPFALTAEGAQLYAVIAPFFSQLPEVAGKLRGEESQHLRLAAGVTVLATHLPKVFNDMRARFPRLRLTLRDSTVSQIGELLAAQEVDIAITIIDGSLPRSARSVELLRLPIVMLVPTSSSIRSFNSLCKDGKDDGAGGIQITEPLISVGNTEPMSQQFQQELRKRGIRWDTHVEVSSLKLIQSYVAQGFGVGITVDIPGDEVIPEVRRIALPKFPPVIAGLVYTGQLKPIAAAFLEIVKLRAAELRRKLQP